MEVEVTGGDWTVAPQEPAARAQVTVAHMEGVSCGEPACPQDSLVACGLVYLRHCGDGALVCGVLHGRGGHAPQGDGARAGKYKLKAMGGGEARSQGIEGGAEFLAHVSGSPWSKGTHRLNLGLPFVKPNTTFPPSLCSLCLVGESHERLVSGS